MTPESSSIRNKRILVKALAVYVAGAWVAVELVGFLASTYEFPRLVVDIAVVFALAGGLATGVITWHHGEPGVQEVSPREKVILGAIALGALVVAGFLLTQDPSRAFRQAEGPRLVVEVPLPPPDDSEAFDLRWGPREGTVDLPHGMFSLDPDMFRLEMPGVSWSLENHPVMFQWADASEFGRATVILPTVPSDLRSLLEEGGRHEQGLIEFGGFALRIDRPFQLESHGDSVVVRVEGRFRPPEFSSDSTGGSG